MPRNPGMPTPPKVPSMGERSGGRIGELSGGSTRIGGPRGAYSGSDAGGGNPGSFVGAGNPFKVGPMAPETNTAQQGGRGTRFYDAYTIKVDGIPGPQTLSAAYGRSGPGTFLGGKPGGLTGGRTYLQGGASGLRPGSTGPEVGRWQGYLKDQGLYRGKIDNSFGPMTYNATKNFQKQYNAQATKDYYALPKLAQPGQIVR